MTREREMMRGGRKRDGKSKKRREMMRNDRRERKRQVGEREERVGAEVGWV